VVYYKEWANTSIVSEENSWWYVVHYLGSLKMTIFFPLEVRVSLCTLTDSLASHLLLKI